MTVRVDAGGAILCGDLYLPRSTRALVVFAHGSGSSRFSSRNRAVADTLRGAGLGTLLLDLLTEAEDRKDALTAQFRFDIPLLAARVTAALDWAHAADATAALSLGLFGASTGAAAALIAAASRSSLVAAVVSRGGRPDLAERALGRVAAPTLLIVGELDDVVVHLNQSAYTRLKAPKELQIVPGATHLFEEPGALEQVSQLARDWFMRNLASGAEAAVTP